MTARAIKRVIARQLGAFMQDEGLARSALAKRMQTSRAQLDRLLDPNNESKITVHKHELTDHIILVLANEEYPEHYILREIVNGGRSKIVALDQVVDLHQHKVERV
ncbi:hypothetical protein ABIC08_008964 [Bradyrhizobium sp. RT9b]|uniref:multiubiquitin domain-containing protein n=1 Tax=Bradyrhizobium sp. RT9b TaxID=3156385 RepID=UPI003396C370